MMIFASQEASFDKGWWMTEYMDRSVGGHDNAQFMLSKLLIKYQNEFNNTCQPLSHIYLPYKYPHLTSLKSQTKLPQSLKIVSAHSLREKGNGGEG